jgi:hypothetical protein
LAVSVVIPCLNEAGTIAVCVEEALETLEREGLRGEVIVADNGSTDGSAALAGAAGARIVAAPVRGYGSACRAGLNAATGEYVVLADGDLSYDFGEIGRMVEALEQGADLVLGNRMDGIQPGAMKRLHRYVGNPLLSGLFNVLFGADVRDAHSGMRAVRRSVVPTLRLSAPGMEFASEMLIQAKKAHLVVREVPIEYRPRGGVSKLSTFRDGWRHLRLLLVRSPTHLFLIPGAVMATIGALGLITVLAHVPLFGREWDVHALIAGALLLIIGTQTIAMGICALSYAAHVLGDETPWFDRVRAHVHAEHGLIAGFATIGTGIAVAAYVAAVWIGRGFGRLAEVRPAILAATLIVIGLQLIFTSFLLALFGLASREQRDV